MPTLRPLRNVVAPQAAVAILLFAYVIAFRTRGISSTFWLLGDQIRDWTIALGPWRSLPLTGTPSSVGGTGLGPVFYWILWIIRHLVGPFADNLPHAGGIGLSILQSAADVLLFLAIARRFASVWLAAAVVLFVATEPYDVALTATIWNPSVAVAFVKVTIALLLLSPAELSLWRSAAVTACAWLAVQAHSSAIFVAAPIIAALPIADAARRRWTLAVQRSRTIAETLLVLEIPLLIERVWHPSTATAPGTVVANVAYTAGHLEHLRIGASLDALTGATAYILLWPWQVPRLVWVLLACAAVAGWRLRRDPLLMAATSGALLATIIGFAFWQQAFDHYWYLTIMPSVALTVATAVTAWPPGRTVISAALLVLIVWGQAARHDFTMTIHRLPEYAALVRGARQIRAYSPAVRAIRTDFTLPATTDPTFVYRVLGGAVTPDSPLVAVIGSAGQVRLETKSP